MHHLRRILHMYRNSMSQEPYDELDDDSSETNQSIISSTISNASTSRLSSASTQRGDEYEAINEHEVSSHLSESLVDAQQELADYIASRRTAPLSARRRLEDLVNRLVLHGEVVRTDEEEEEEEEEDSEEDSEEEDSEEESDDDSDSNWTTDSDNENRQLRRKKKKSVEEPRVRTFVVGMRHGEVIVESFPDLR